MILIQLKNGLSNEAKVKDENLKIEVRNDQLLNKVNESGAFVQKPME